MVHLPCPIHRTFEWTGKWSDDDTKSWTERFKKKLNYSKADDGAFWIEWSDFTVNFEVRFAHEFSSELC